MVHQVLREDGVRRQGHEQADKAENRRDGWGRDRCKIEAFAFIPPCVAIEDEVFVGPHVCFTNDKYPKPTGEWENGETLVRKGASISFPTYDSG